MRLAIFSLIGLAWATLSLGAEAPGEANRAVRSLTLEQCIRLALEQNFRIALARYAPIIQGYAVAVQYGIYDPEISATARQSKSTTEGGFDPSLNTLTVSTENTTDSLTPALRGKLPTGLTYTLGGSFSHQRGTAGRFGEPFDDYRASADLSLQQPLLRGFWTDPDRTQIQVEKKNLKISELAFEDEVRLVVRDVALAYYGLIFAREDVKVQEKALQLAEALLAQNKEKVRVGVLAPLDEKQAESEVAARRADLIAARREVAFQENVLKNLLTDRYEAWYAVTVEPAEKLVAVPQSYDLQESWTSALTLRPDFRQVKEEVEREGLIVKLRFNQLFPALDLIGGYGRSGFDESRPGYQASLGGALEDISEGRNPRYNFGVVFSFPLSSQSERNQYKQAKQRKLQAETRVRQAHQVILVEVDDSISQAKSAYERVAATHEAVLFAEAALDAEQKKLDSGKSTSFEVLRLQRDLTSARTEEIRALREYNIALARLHASDGTILQRNRISLQFK
jgi:outer membrane protein TolC